MTVDELIAVLRGFPPDAKVQVYDSQGVDQDVVKFAAEITNQGSRVVLNREQFYS